MPESACASPSGSKNIRVERHGFDSIPGQSKLFLHFLKGVPSLQEYYPNAVSSHDDLAGFADVVLKSYTTDRDVICDILARQNRLFGCGQPTLENIELLRKADCVAVLTGQQAGLFTGPLYTIYKALSVIRSAGRLRKLGVNAVPVFWIATEDHDFDEVSHAFSISGEGRLNETTLTGHEADIGKPVGAIEFDRSIQSIADELFRTLPTTEFSAEIQASVSRAYAPGETFGTSFARLLTHLLGKYGLIVFDPMDEAAKPLSSPIVRAAVERSEEIVGAIIDRSEQLDAAGYHAQVLVGEDYFPLFWNDDDGIRRSLKHTKSGAYRANGKRSEFTTNDLLKIASERPERLSPGVMLRPVVQDVLFPTICYFGGAAEIAYFAQNSEVYRILERHVTTILPRQSFTIVDRKHQRTMEKYGFKFVDLFAGTENLWPELVEHMIDPETPRVFVDAEHKINNELDRLDQQLSKIDPTLSESLSRRRRKIIYHIEALRKKFHRIHIEKDEMINRRVQSLFDSLLPNGALQERSINFSTFANRYGLEFVHWLYESIDLDDNRHKLTYL